MTQFPGVYLAYIPYSSYKGTLFEGAMTGSHSIFLSSGWRNQWENRLVSLNAYFYSNRTCLQRAGGVGNRDGEAPPIKIPADNRVSKTHFDTRGKSEGN